MDMSYSCNRTGGLAQLGERLPCTQEVSGSIPLSSTILVVSCQMLVIIKMIINICHLTDIVLYKLEVFVIYQANI
jgi:hypothetical protein